MPIYKFRHKMLTSGHYDGIDEIDDDGSMYK